jgi:hypothetical protein
MRMSAPARMCCDSLSRATSLAWPQKKNRCKEGRNEVMRPYLRALWWAQRPSPSQPPNASSAPVRTETKKPAFNAAKTGGAGRIVATTSFLPHKPSPVWTEGPGEAATHLVRCSKLRCGRGPNAGATQRGEVEQWTSAGPLPAIRLLARIF